MSDTELVERIVRGMGWVPCSPPSRRGWWHTKGICYPENFLQDERDLSRLPEPTLDWLLTDPTGPYEGKLRPEGWILDNLREWPGNVYVCSFMQIESGASRNSESRTDLLTAVLSAIADALEAK